MLKETITRICGSTGVHSNPNPFRSDLLSSRISVLFPPKPEILLVPSSAAFHHTLLPDSSAAISRKRDYFTICTRKIHFILSAAKD